MNKKIEELLQKLRDAMYEAIAGSWDVAEAMAKLEQEGRCPSLSVDVTLMDDPPQNEETGFDEGLVLTDYDQQFLRAIKVASPV
jgi:hypothetical protein